MRNLLKSVCLAGVSTVAMAGTAAASLVIESWNESNPAALTSGSIGQKNDALTVLGLSSLGGYYGSQIRLTSDAAVTYTLFGFEAGYKNKFVSGGNVFDTESFGTNRIFDVAGLGSFTQSSTAGLLDFSFLTNGGRKSIVNGNENINNFGLGGVRNPDFFASVVGDSGAVSGNSLWIFLDDLGAGPDDDHDDMVVRIDLSSIPMAPVPLPAGAVLMGTGIAGLGLLRRRRKA